MSLRVCLVSSSLGHAFRELGHDILELHPPAGLLDIGRALAERGFAPDLIIQEEALGGRVVLLGLEDLPCPRLFRAIDPHQNLFWQTVYSRLFDAVLPTQAAAARAMRESGIAAAVRLPWHGAALPWTPFEARTRDLAFVGRVTPKRPSRQEFVRLLADRFGAAVAEDMTRQDMLALYGATRIAPNEAIMGELNFRLFEAASAGCLVLNPDIGEEMDGVLEPGREVEVFAHALELEAKLRWFLKRPAEAKVRAFAAWSRIRREHLPEHRARFILNLAAGLGRNGASGHAAQKWLWLTLFELGRSGRLNLDAGTIEAGLRAVPGAPDVAAALLAHLFESGEGRRREEAMALMAAVLERNEHQDSLALNLAGAMASLRLGSFAMALAFWRRQAPSRPAPGTPGRLCVAWAGELSRRGLVVRAGFPFDPERHLPAAAFEALLEAHRLDPEDLDIVRRLDALLAGQRGLDQTRLGFLSLLSLHDRNDWRIDARLGLASLRAFRLEAGMEELALARERAEAKGEGEKLDRLLASEDPGGTAGRFAASLAPEAKTAYFRPKC